VPVVLIVSVPFGKVSVPFADTTNSAWVWFIGISQVFPVFGRLVAMTTQFPIEKLEVLLRLMLLEQQPCLMRPLLLPV
jgi:hypothetical protein